MPDTLSEAQRRRQAENRGRRAEGLALLLLRLKGYRVLGHRVRTPVGEVDIVARRGPVLVIVEVKARATLAQAMEAIPHQARRRIERAALWYAGHHTRFGKLGLRFDVIVVTPKAWPRHIRDAWRMGD